MKKKLICLLLVCLLLPVLCVSALAEETEYAQWIISEDGEELSLDGKTYTWYPMAYGDLLKPEEGYIYENEVTNPVNDEDLTVVVNPDNPHMVFLGYYTGRPERVYVTEEGRRILDAFVNGEFSEYLLADGTYEAAPISADLVARMDAQTEDSVTMDVTELRDRTLCEIVGYDETHTLAHAHAGVYVLSGGYYYINYDALDNTHFDADGDFSYRSGTVTLVKMDTEDARTVSLAISNMEVWSTVYTYESSLDNVEMDKTSATAGFFIMSIIGGLVIPAVPLVLGLVFAKSKKSLNPNKWYLLSSLAALWIILAAVIVMMTITPA